MDIKITWCFFWKRFNVCHTLGRIFLQKMDDVLKTLLAIHIISVEESVSFIRNKIGDVRFKGVEMFGSDLMKREPYIK